MRHSSTVMLYSLRRLINNQPMIELLLGRPNLQVLGLNRKKILGAAADGLRGVIDISITQPENTEGGKSSRVFHAGVLYSDKGLHCLFGEMEDDWLNLEVDDPMKKKVATEDTLHRASKAGLFVKRLHELRGLLLGFHSVPRRRAGPLSSANVELMKMELAKHP